MAPKKFPQRITIAVIGCGGTGSALMQNLMPYLAHRHGDPLVRIILCDGDTVEEKNLARQVFFEDQVGLNKAMALAESIEATFDMTVSVCSHYLETVSDVDALFADAYTKQFPVLISCVDNLKARSVYEAWFEKQPQAVYVDCANEEYHGEVVYATRFNEKTISPVRSIVFPSFRQLLEEEIETLQFRSEMDCLQRSLSTPQHIFTNKMSGLLAANAISVFLDTQMPPMGVDYFSMRPVMSITHRDTTSLIPAVVEESKPKPKRRKKAG